MTYDLDKLRARISAHGSSDYANLLEGDWRGQGLLAALARIDQLEKALRDIRDIAGDRERFVMQGPRGFITALRVVDDVLGERGGK